MDTDISLTCDDAGKSTEMDTNRIGIHSTTDAKPLSFTNGVLKRHRHLINPIPASTVAYKECLKNHAAAQGGHALDGCGEFMPYSPSTNHNIPTSLECAACGCHRNFHRREWEDSPSPLQLLTPSEYHPQHRHHPPLSLPSARATSPYPPSPPPISSSYYSSSAPHMLLALSSGFPPTENSQQTLGAVASNPVSGSGRKRFRTKFSSEQKDKMYEFAERLGWKLQKTDDELVNEFCKGAGVGREVFKVWMHNNKSTLGKRSSSSADAGHNNGYSIFHHQEDANNGKMNTIEQHTATPSHSSLSHNHNNLNGDDMVHHLHHHSEGNGGNMTTNGSFS